jgi:hypothetical protein
MSVWNELLQQSAADTLAPNQNRGESFSLSFARGAGGCWGAKCARAANGEHSGSESSHCATVAPWLVLWPPGQNNDVLFRSQPSTAALEEKEEDWRRRQRSRRRGTQPWSSRVAATSRPQTSTALTPAPTRCRFSHWSEMRCTVVLHTRHVLFQRGHMLCCVRPNAADSEPCQCASGSWRMRGDKRGRTKLVSMPRLRTLAQLAASQRDLSLLLRLLHVVGVVLCSLAVRTCK